WADGAPATGGQLDLGEARLGAVAEAPLDAAEADAVVLARMGRVVALLARRPACPQCMRAGLFQYRLGALRAKRRRALGVLHAGFQDVALTKLDGIEAESARDLVDTDLGCCKRLHC